VPLVSLFTAGLVQGVPQSRRSSTLSCPVGVFWTFSTVVELLRLPVTKIAIPISRTKIPTTSRIQPAVLMLNPRHGDRERHDRADDTQHDVERDESGSCSSVHRPRVVQGRRTFNLQLATEPRVRDRRLGRRAPRTLAGAAPGRPDS